MAITSYAELQAEIASWLNRDDLAGTIPSFISLAERTMFRQVRIRQMLKRVRATLDEDFETLPDDFLEAVSLKLLTTPETPVSAVEPAVMDMLKARGSTGRPRYFAPIGNDLTVYPARDQDYTVELLYYARPDALSGSVSSNVILATWPDLYLWGSLAASAPFLREDERIATWGSLYRGSLAEVGEADPPVRAVAAPLLTELSDFAALRGF
ncbi:hypothetical protein M5E06_10335 [Azospirillum sp. A1-3]|uniref:phage adaptor protein n=1 Tax=Azospirillum sp. A1-3 TaxID=185874 RepID=UPI0020771D33|nr:hypothetical protein [Azospirillum sp. A1-3]MCM8734591.1 hypothetical protein [Azospirillum sp. A1-3]